MVEFYNEDLELPPVEMIDAELKKIKCGCKQDSNYFVFGQGFFCTQCFAKLKGVEFVQLLELANVFEKSAYAYRDNKKSATSDFNQLADRITKKHEALRKRRDQLKTDMATQKNYTINRVDNMIEHCLNENLNHALEDLYEPSLTSTDHFLCLVSSNMSNVDLLSRNLDNLKVEDRKGEVVYSFQ